MFYTHFTWLPRFFCEQRHAPSDSTTFTISPQGSPHFPEVEIPGEEKGIFAIIQEIVQEPGCGSVPPAEQWDHSTIFSKMRKIPTRAIARWTTLPPQRGAKHFCSKIQNKCLSWTTH